MGQVSNGLIITQDSDDTLEAAVLCRKVGEGGAGATGAWSASPYDVAIHQVAGLLVERSNWSIGDIYSLLRRSYPYSTMSIEKLKRVLTYMRERYPRLAVYNESDGRVYRARDIKPLFDYYFENLSMIPDEKQYLVMEKEKLRRARSTRRSSPSTARWE